MSTYSLTGSLAGLRRDHDRLLVEVGNAKDEGIKRDATILARSIRKTLSVTGSGRPSAKGSPPHKQEGKLAKSVRQGVVGAGRVVAVMRFTALWHEQGHTAQAQRRRKGGGKGQPYTLRLAARPFMERSLAAVRDEMVTAVVPLLAGIRP